VAYSIRVKGSIKDPSVKVHIVLKDDVCGDSERCLGALNEIETVAGITDVNQKRLQRYRVISGNVPQSKIDTVRKLAVVASVSVDSEKFAV
jgi:hypothetical protein